MSTTKCWESSRIWPLTICYACLKCFECPQFSSGKSNCQSPETGEFKGSKLEGWPKKHWVKRNHSGDLTAHLNCLLKRAIYMMKRGNTNLPRTPLSLSALWEVWHWAVMNVCLSISLRFLQRNMILTQTLTHTFTISVQLATIRGTIIHNFIETVHKPWYRKSFILKNMYIFILAK